MATTVELTPRQQEIKDLITKKGLKAPEIAKKLGISDNAVYQQLRKIREAEKAAKGGGATPKKAAATKGNAKKGGTNARKADTPKPAPQPAAAPPAPEPDVRVLTPLQAVRARRKEITAETSVVHEAVAKARAELEAAVAAEEKVTSKHAAELGQLDQAESALTGKTVVDGKVVRPPRTPEPASEAVSASSGDDEQSTGSGLAAVPDPAPGDDVAPTDDPAELARRGDAAAEAEAASAAAEAPQE